jgi:hypothetical protein
MNQGVDQRDLHERRLPAAESIARALCERPRLAASFSSASSEARRTLMF